MVSDGTPITYVDKKGIEQPFDLLILRDGVAGAFPILTHAHHEIHEGSGFTSCKKFTHGAGASPNVLIVTPDSAKRAHFTFQVISDDVLEVNLTKLADYSGGSDLSSFNRDEESIVDSKLTLTTDATDDGGGKGTLIWTFKGGANKTVTSSESERFEFILARNRKYLLEAIGANLDLITVLLEWYEHTSGDFDGME